MTEYTAIALAIGAPAVAFALGYLLATARLRAQVIEARREYATYLLKEARAYRGLCEDFFRSPERQERNPTMKNDHNAPRRHPIAIELDRWLSSPEGLASSRGETSGIYLRNRLKAAFGAGWNALERRVRDAVGDEAP